MGLQIFDQYEAPFNYSHLGTATGTSTANVKGSPGILYGVTINQKATAAALITLYDNTAASGTTIIGIIDPTSNVQTLFYNCSFQKGLSYQSTPGTNTGADVTFIYV